MFPSGIVINPIERQYRTSKANSVFSLISCISSNTGSSKIKKVSKNADFLSLVAEGFELSNLNEFVNDFLRVVEFN